MKALSRILPKPAVLFLLQKLEKRDTDLGRRAKGRLRRLRVRASVQAFRERCAKLGRNDICMDCGANVGAVTVQMAATGATVHAYEPDPRNFDALEAAVGHLPNVELHMVALGATEGQATLRRLHDKFGTEKGRGESSSTYFKDPALFSDNVVQVEQRAFGTEVTRLGGRIALVKMDIEGAEFEILPQVFADPERQGFDALFVETHERMAPSEIPVMERMRRQAARLSAPYISLDWP